LLNRRALLMLLADVSLSWILLGALDVPVAAAGVAWHAENSTASASSPSSADTGHGCRSRSGDPGDDNRCCERHCCGPSPSPQPTTTPVPASAPTPRQTPSRTPQPTPRLHPRPAPVIANHPTDTPRPQPSSGATMSPGTRSGARPPVLAPPALTIPAVNPTSARAPGLEFVSVIALSTVLVAATVAVASLVLIRRSS
jgi:hypothetical protein